MYDYSSEKLMTVQAPPAQPSLPWRLSSSAVMGFVGGLARLGLYAGNKVEVHGLDKFKALVDARENPDARTRGLITVSNHTSVMDDPLIWGTLPFAYHFRPNNHRWTLGSYDICFQGTVLSTIFNLGQLLPTHRRKHSTFGGLFQPTMTEAIRLLNDCPVYIPPERPSIHNNTPPPTSEDRSTSVPEIPDPFSSASLTYTTNGTDCFQRPSAFYTRRHSWIHIFPEGFVHQHPARAMRYFKWGVARLILEADECPDVIPIWHEGSERLMPEDRGFPRPVPRLGQNVGIWFGENVAGEKTSAEGNVFAELRDRWRDLVRREQKRLEKKGLVSSDDVSRIGRPESLSEELKYGDEAVKLRIECTMKVREAVLAVRRQRGLPDEDPKARLVDTYREEGGAGSEGRKPDGSLVKDV